MGKLISLDTAETGSLWMVITVQAKINSEWAVFCTFYDVKKKKKTKLTEVIGNHQEALERFLGFADEVNEILQDPHQQGSAGSDLQGRQKSVTMASNFRVPLIRTFSFITRPRVLIDFQHTWDLISNLVACLLCPDGK